MDPAKSETRMSKAEEIPITQIRIRMGETWLFTILKAAY
jgi:hypothetical protein